jgi:5'-deoxynucleotidase YfbR-like HD superfamily hydrolase
MYGAYLIGRFYLQQTLDESHEGYEEYDKSTILDMLLIHDWGEAFTGDIVNKTEQQQDDERDWLEYISLLGTYEGLAPLIDIQKLYSEFEGKSINACIAHDIDKIENLLQLYIYHRDKNNRIPDFKKWKQGLFKKLDTSIGRDIFIRIQNFGESL